MDISIIAIGDELLIGQVTDTNSGWIARHLSPLGWSVRSVRTVHDSQDAILDAINEAFAQTDIVITTGGLGPTKDDITKPTLCKYFGGQLVHDPEVEQNLLDVLRRRHRDINTYTAAQAMVPSSCRVIQNRVGTAPIMWFEKNGKVLVALPGVPFEMEHMMESEVIPQLLAHFAPNDCIIHRTFVVVDYMESLLAMKLDEFERSMPSNIHLAYLPKMGVIRLRLSGSSTDSSRLQSDIDMLSNDLHKILGNAIISDEDKTMGEILGDHLRAQSLTVATAESCTGGYISHQITAIPGSSDYYRGSIIAYSNDVKRNLLGVSQDDLNAHGAVSQPVVEQMCRGAAAALHTDCAIATSGIAGPGGGTPDKPVGTVWIAVAANGKVFSEKAHFPGSRDRVIDRAATHALTMLIKLLRTKPANLQNSTLCTTFDTANNSRN